MSESEARFDVRVLRVPATTPQGEPFSPALARAFGIPLATAQRLADEAPAYVKRGVAHDVAAGMQKKLAELGATVEVVEAAAPGSRPASKPPAAASLSLPPVPSPGSYSIVHGPVAAHGSVAVAVGVGTPVPAAVAPTSHPRPTSRPPPAFDPGPGVDLAALLPTDTDPDAPLLAPAPSPSGPALAIPPPRPRSSAPPPPLGPPIELAAVALPRSTRPPPPEPIAPRTPLPPPPKGFSIPPLAIVAAVVGLLAFGWLLVARGIMRTGDVQMLGNTPESETWCVNAYCLTGRETGERYMGKRALMVAWRAGCLEDQDYRTYLEGLAVKHREDLVVVGVALATPAKKAARGLPPALAQPPPETWPPDGCSPAFDVLPVDQGYVADRINPPVTYLLDEKGRLIATWRGGMSPEQRERLATWLDGKAWDQR